MKSIFLHYCKCNGVENFGDILSPYIIERLSGQEVRYRDPFPSTSECVSSIIIEFKKSKKISFNNLKLLIYSILHYNIKILFSTGSILGWGSKKCYYWGSGFISSTSGFQGGKVYATRGPKSQERLKSLGYECGDAYGDPALLLPLLKRGSSNKKYKISIVPHYQDFEYIKNTYGEDYNVINLQTTDIDYVVNEITSSEYVLSTSLHGIIVSHAYNVPALWIQREELSAGDGFKFDDYFSSVGIESYIGFKDYNEWFLQKDEDEIIEYICNTYADLMLPKSSVIMNLQKDLLSCAPFSLLPKYRNYTDQHTL